MVDDLSATLKSALASLTQRAAGKGKIHAYAHIMVALAKLLEPNGALDPKVSKQLKKQMKEAKISPACIRRYIDKSVGAFKANRDLLKAARSGDIEQVLKVFDDLEISTETGIHAIGFKKADPLDQQADKLAKLEPEQFVEVVSDRLTAARQRRQAKANKSPTHLPQVANGKQAPAKVNESLTERANAQLTGPDVGAVRYEANLLGIDVRIEVCIREASSGGRT